jgi:hypothetical protein
LLSENLPLTTYGEIKRTSASELAEWISVTWRITGKRWNISSRNAALQMRLKPQKTSYGTTLNFTAWV